MPKREKDTDSASTAGEEATRAWYDGFLSGLNPEKEVATDASEWTREREAEGRFEADNPEE